MLCKLLFAGFQYTGWEGGCVIGVMDSHPNIKYMGSIFIYSWNVAMAAGKKEKKIRNSNKHKGKKSGIKLCIYNTLIMLRSLLASGFIVGSSSQTDKRVSMGGLQKVLLAATK